jgi:hypothetical protein
MTASVIEWHPNCISKVSRLMKGEFYDEHGNRSSHYAFIRSQSRSNGRVTRFSIRNINF